MKAEKLKKMLKEIIVMPASSFSIWEIGFICHMAEEKDEYNSVQEAKIKEIYRRTK